MHFQKIIYTPISMKQKIIKKHHNSKIHKHSKAGKIMKYIQKNYYFSGMKKLIEKHIAVCAKYNQNKATRHNSYEEIKILEISKQT